MATNVTSSVRGNCWNQYEMADGKGQGGAVRSVVTQVM